jgi:putative lipoprotein
MRAITKISYGLFVMHLLVGCLSTNSSTHVVKGTVSYLERVVLSPSAKLEIILADVSLADAPYKLIHQKTISPMGQVPITFEISYDPHQIIENHTYAVMARITDQGALLFINDKSFQVITRNNTQDVQMTLKRVSH